MKKIFNPEEHGMTTCSSCVGKGFIQNPDRQHCPQCEGFGFIRNEERQEVVRNSFNSSAGKGDLDVTGFSPSDSINFTGLLKIITF
jgi:DnaJ-class molecular chaperone